jgi:hypothetical protein
VIHANNIVNSVNEPRVSQRLITEVADGSIWVNLVRQSHENIDVDFSASNVAVNAYAINALYKPDVTTERLPQGYRMIILFPEHRDQRLKVLDTELRGRYSDIEVINEAIAERMHRVVQDKPVQIAICWRDYVYRVSGVKGNLYLFWCQSLQVIKRDALRNERRIDKITGFPLLVNTDGHLRILAYYPLVMGQMRGDKFYFLCPAAVKPSYNIAKPLYPHDKVRLKGSSPSSSGHLQQLQTFQIENDQRREIVGDHEVKGYEHAIEQLRQSNVAMGFVDPESEVEFLVYLEQHCPWFTNEDECLAMPAGEFHDKIANARQLYYVRRQFSKQLDGPGMPTGNDSDGNSDGSVTLRSGPTQKEIEDSQVAAFLCPSGDEEPVTKMTERTIIGNLVQQRQDTINDADAQRERHSHIQRLTISDEDESSSSTDVRQQQHPPRTPVRRGVVPTGMFQRENHRGSTAATYSRVKKSPSRQPTDPRFDLLGSSRGGTDESYSVSSGESSPVLPPAKDVTTMRPPAVAPIQITGRVSAYNSADSEPSPIDATYNSNSVELHFIRENN